MVRTVVLGVCVVAVWGVAGLAGGGAARGADVVAAGTKPQGELETRLLGKWQAGACCGSLELKADGTFERHGYSPGNSRLAGTWRISWDALPPTLALDCLESDDESWVGRKDRPKILVLSDRHLGLVYLPADTAWPKGDRAAVADSMTVYDRVRGEGK